MAIDLSLWVSLLIGFGFDFPLPAQTAFIENFLFWV